MPKSRKEIILGNEYGWLTVLEEAPKDATGHIRWKVRCRCGTEYMVQTCFLSKLNCKCRNCSDAYDRPKQKCDHSGETVNGWQIMEIAGKTAAGVALYRCKCVNCGSVSIKTYGTVVSRKGNSCIHCKPDYQFSIHGNSATGILPDGTEFKLDTSLIPLFQKYHWKRNSNGYITRSQKSMPKLHLHWLAMGFDGPPDLLIDHINRDKTDCRSCNLRFVTQQQNSMNRSMGRNSTTGYVGVCFHKHKNCYMAKISLNNRHIHLGYSRDPVECAQMYNIASQILFGEYRGYQNDVPPATVFMQQRIQKRCRPYMVSSSLAQQPCVRLISA